jgi:hypothetical protein
MGPPGYSRGSNAKAGSIREPFSLAEHRASDTVRRYLTLSEEAVRFTRVKAVGIVVSNFCGPL